jgi:hypothetical protein
MLTCMPALRIDDVPEDVLAILKKRADTQGLSLSHYIRTLLIMESEKDEEGWTEEQAQQWFAQVEASEPGDLSDEDILTAIRIGRCAECQRRYLEGER